MLIKSHVPTQAALRDVLGQVTVEADATPRPPDTGNAPASSGPPKEPRAKNTAEASTSAACRVDSAIHDIAALREGTLSPEGIRRLAHHLPRCESCRILIAGLVSDAHQVECTGQHDASPAAAVPK